MEVGGGRKAGKVDFATVPDTQLIVLLFHDNATASEPLKLSRTGCASRDHNCNVVTAYQHTHNTHSTHTHTTLLFSLLTKFYCIWLTHILLPLNYTLNSTTNKNIVFLQRMLKTRAYLHTLFHILFTIPPNRQALTENAISSPPFFPPLLNSLYVSRMWVEYVDGDTKCLYDK